MRLKLRAAAAVSVVLITVSCGDTAFAQKQGGILRMFSPDSPASMSILEEATVFAEGPMMGVFNNLVMFDQNVQQSGLSSIVPDLATGWSWSEDAAMVQPVGPGSGRGALRFAGHAQFRRHRSWSRAGA